MIRFTDSEIQTLRQRAKRDPSVVEQLKKECEPVFSRPITVPKTAVATWGGFYYCSDHSAPLIFDIDRPKEHRCSVDGHIFTGEPYDGSWWSRRNGMNADAVEKMADLYLITQDIKWAEKAIAILMAYAQVYKDYEVHGNIPCNLSGKAFAQAITDSSFVRRLAIAYDTLEPLLTPEQKEKMREGLFFPAADFLMQQRSSQLHNHEVVIDSAIAAIGVVFSRKDYIDFAVYGDYGLFYQLDHGILEDGFWIEGSVGYHFFTLQNLFSYEKLARHTPYSTLSHPGILKMLHMVLHLLQPDDNYPCLNDMGKSSGGIAGSGVMEFAYSQYHDPILLKALHTAYKDRPRRSLDSFFYGDETLPDDPTPDQPLEKKEYHNENGSGITILRGNDQRYLLIKHGPYGGEHDHFDRLGISFLSHGKPIAYDMGTTGYGAKMHYQYYKNTATHNVVSIDGLNQPPSSGWVNRFLHRDDGVLLDVGTGWAKPYQRPNIFSLTEWDEEVYRGVTMRRRILWADRYWIDLFTVEGADPQRSIDYTFHFSGERITHLPGETPCGPINQQKPQCYLSDATSLEPDPASLLSEEKAVRGIPVLFDCGGVTAAAHLFSNGHTLFFAQGPDNPGTTDIPFVIQRQKGGSALFLTLIETYPDQPFVQSVSARMHQGAIHLEVIAADGTSITHILD